jgi:hypothetical protein
MTITTLTTMVVLFFILLILVSINQNLQNNKKPIVEKDSTFKILDSVGQNRFKSPISTIEVRQVTEDFRNGVTHNWIIIQLGLYKLYAENKLLDYDSLFKELVVSINSLNNDPNELKKWNLEYLSYLKEKMEGEENNI